VVLPWSTLAANEKLGPLAETLPWRGGKWTFSLIFKAKGKAGWSPSLIAG
jgi:hypothetical protein